MLVLDGNEEGALVLASRRVRPIFGSDLAPNIKRIFTIGAAPLQSSCNQTRYQCDVPPLSKDGQ
jgi:hypothetical protein